MLKRFLCAAAMGILIGASNAAIERREEGALVIEGIPEIPADIIEDLRRYQNIRTAVIADWAADGDGMLITTRFAETYQMHWVGMPGGARYQLTFYPEPVRDGAIRPDLNREEFLFLMDVGGGEFFQIHLFDLKTGEDRRLTDGEGRNGGIVWANRGDRFAYYSTKRNGRDWDVWVMNPESPSEAKTMLEAGGAWVPIEWSPDDSKLLVAKYVSANDIRPHLLDLATGDLEPINPSEEKIAYGGGVWAKDGKGLYFGSDEGTEFQHLRFYDLETKSFENLTADIPWDVEAMEISGDGKTLAFIANEDGLSTLYLMSTATGERRRVSGLPLGQIYGLKFHPDHQRLAMVLNTPQTPGDVYVLDITDDSLVRWTYSEVGGLPTDRFIIPELIRYPTFDGVDGKPREIPAFVYKPTNGNAKHPVLIQIHGGPESQFVPYFSSSIQYYLRELGVAVIAPNVRGSAGYGKSYLKLDNGLLREDSVKDIGALLDWIGEQDDLDAGRVAVMGGSYGGYMTLASMIHFSDRLKAGVDSVGISNFITFLENTEDYRRDLRRIEYGDEREAEMRKFLEDISPLNNAEKIRGALFVAQGLNDPRVPAGEAEQIVEAVRKNDVPVWYLLAKDEGHGFAKKSNADYFTQATVLFLREHLLK